jgi:hypothetical protein
MANQDQANNAGKNPAPRSFVERIFAGTTTQSLIQTAGIVFAFVAAAAFLYAILKIIKSDGGKNIQIGENFWQTLIVAHFEIIAIVLIGVLVAFIALRLFSKAGSLTSEVIRERDRSLLTPLIASANKEAIGEYIRLASLSGFTGTFQYLGFTGLPLATVGLTLILLAISLWVDDDELKKGVFDMAKLTLGAFLGSFVQRNLETEKLTQAQGAGGSGSGATATDERVSTGTVLEELASQAKKVRTIADEKSAAVDENKRSQVEAISTTLGGIEQKIRAAQDSARDPSQSIEKVRTATTEAKTAAAQLGELTTKLQAI